MKRSLPIPLVVTAAILVAPPAAASAADQERIRAIEAYVQQYQHMAAFDGVVLIARDSEIVWQKAFGFAEYARRLLMSTDAVFRIAALSKQATKAAIGLLAEQDKLRLDSRLAEFLPDFPNAKRITIRQLLDHTAGIAHTDQLAWMDMQRAMSVDDIVDGLSREELLFPPGHGKQYSNGGYALLAKVIEIASGKSFDNFIDSEIAARGFTSFGHETPFEVVPGMVGRYTPGPVYGERVEAETDITANRIGGGSLHASAEDVFRFFRASTNGDLLSPETTAALFALPGDGEIRVTGHSPGALAQVYLDIEDGLTVVTLSSNSAWPAGFNTDIVSLYRGEDVPLTTFSLSSRTLTEGDISAVTGDFVAERFGWEVSIEPGDANLVFVQGDVRSAFARSTDGEFHLPIYDWLCRYGDYGLEFECRQRDPDATIRFRFSRQ